MSADALAPELPAAGSSTVHVPIGGGRSELVELAQQVKATQALTNTRWDSLTVEQKLERMRQVLKNLDHMVHWHSNRFQELSDRLDALSEHAHAEGKVLVPIISKRRGGGYGMEAQEKKGEGWF